MNYLERKVVVITVFGHALCHFFMLILAGALMAIVTDFKSSTSEITAIGTICYFIFGLGAFPAGILVSHFNPKRVLQGFFLLSALASLLIGLSKDIGAFTAGLALLGLFGSLYHVSGVTLITQTIKIRGKALGIHGVAGSAGIALSPFIAGIVLIYADWQFIYLLAAILGMAGFLFLFFDRTIPYRHSQIDQNEPVRFNRNIIPVFGLMIVVMMINGLVYRGFLTMLPTYVSEKLISGSLLPKEFLAILPSFITEKITSGSPIIGGLISMLILSVGMIGQYMGGHLSDRKPMVRLYFIMLILSLPFLCLLGFVQQLWIVVTGLLFALFHFPQQPIENHLISKWMPSRWTGSGYGVKFAATFGAGAFGSVLSGIISEQAYTSLVFPILSGFVFVSCVLIFIMMLYLKKKTNMMQTTPEII